MFQGPKPVGSVKPPVVPPTSGKAPVPQNTGAQGSVTTKSTTRLPSGPTKIATPFANPQDLIKGVLASALGQHHETLPVELLKLALETTSAFGRLSTALKSSQTETVPETVHQNLNRLVDILDRGQKLLESQSRISLEDRREYVKYLANSIPSLSAQASADPRQISASVDRFLVALPKVFAEGLLSDVRSLLSTVKSSAELATFANVVDQLIHLSPSERGQVLLALRQARQSGQTVSTVVAEAIIHEVGKHSLGEPNNASTENLEQSVHESSDQGAQTNSAFQDVYVFGKLPQSLTTQQSEASQASENARPTSFKFYPLQKSVEILSQTIGPQAVAVFEKIFSGEGRVTSVDVQAIETFVNLLKSADTNVAQKILPQLMLAWISRHEAVRARVLQILKVIATEDKQAFLNENGLSALKVMARDRRSLELQYEAIQLALDLFGGDEGRKQDEWNAFFQEVELVPTLTRLLRSAEDLEVQMGLELFRRTWSLVGSAGKERLVNMVLQLAQEHPSDEVAEQAMGLLFVHKGELTRHQMLGLLENYEGLVRASQEEYRNGGAHFVGNAAPKKSGVNSATFVGAWPILN